VQLFAAMAETTILSYNKYMTGVLYVVANVSATGLLAKNLEDCLKNRRKYTA